MRNLMSGTAAAAAALLTWSCAAAPGSPPQEGSNGGEPARSVQTVRVGRRDLVREITLPGSVVAYEQAVLYAKASGYVRKISVDKGDRVRRGQVLAELEIPEMANEEDQARARRQEAEADSEVKRITFERLSTVREREPDVVSQQEVDQARFEMQKALAAREVARADEERMKTLMEYSRIRAPFSGVVTERFVDPGALIQTAAATRQATPVVTVMNMSVVRIYVQVPETEVSFVREGTPAVLEVDALGAMGKRFEASVTRFASALDPATRTMKVEIDVANPERKLLHGMYGEVTLTLEERKQALSLPAEALLADEGGAYVFCVEDGTLVRRAVTTGFDDARVVEIRSGLEGDERVVVGDRAGLREGMRVEPQAAPPEL